MNMGKYLSVVLVSVISSFFIMATHVEAREYSFSVKRFQVSGNLSGNSDEFNDGVLYPWTIQGGVAVESGDVLTLSSPGQVETFLQNNLEVTHERSSVEVSARTGDFAVAAVGHGNFTVESRWEPVLPALNLSYGMTFHYPPTEFDQVRIGIDNVDALSLSSLGAPAEMQPGTYVSFLQISPQGTDPLNLSFEYQAVSVTQEISEAIVFQLIFNDDNDSFSAAFSLDGGSTFSEPFSPFSIHREIGDIDPLFVELEVISRTVRPVPVPPTLILLGSGLAGLAIFGRNRLFKKV
jgi:hypothetical protein